MLRNRLTSYYPWLAIALWAVVCFVFFQFAYEYHFFYKEQNQLFLCSADYLATYHGPGWLARLAGDFLTQYFYYRYAGAAILALCLLGVGALLYASLHRLGLWRWLALVVALVAMLIEAVFHLRYDFPLSGTVAVMGWALFFFIYSRCEVRGTRYEDSSSVQANLAPRTSHLAPRISHHAPRTSYLVPRTSHLVPRKILPLFIILPLAVWLFGQPQLGRIGAPEWQLERMLAVDNEYRFGNYDRVVSLVEQEEQPLPEMMFFYNLVMAQRGQLPDQLLRYVPNELGTLHRIGPDTPLYTIKNMNELYWVLGDMTFTERAAMMANVFSKINRNVRMVKRLAECNLVSGDTLASRKYLRLLEQTVAYADWARQAPTAPLYRQKAQSRNLQDTLAVTDNSHFIMMQLLDSNPQNTVALDYMLCTELLLKDITNFKRDYDRYCSERPRLKRLYQEALCIWLAGTNAPREEWQRLILMPEVAQRFQQYNQQRGSGAFRDTYWYYFDKAQTHQQP
ncbi:MAG: hypothetical protein II792_01840 [Prevotella sp.]|nr:hypothetical protein [Prevotella sp.]